MTRKTVGILALVGALVLVGMMLVPRPGSYTPYGTRLLNPRPAYDFTLTSHLGRLFRLSELRGKATLIFFGFVNCPDICPTTLHELKRVYEALTPQEQGKVQVLMISVDPERDTPERLARYIPFFNPEFLGLTGTPGQIADVAKNYGVFYQKTEATSPTEYEVAHTASVFLLDPKGRLRLIYGSGKTSNTEKLLADLRWLLGE